MNLGLLLIVLGISAYTDIKRFKIYNILLYPAIGFLGWQTGNWIEIGVALLTMAILIKSSLLKWHGGDAKLFMLIASAIGWMFVPILAMTYVSIDFYRFMQRCKAGLPVAPFVLASTIIFLIMAATLKRIVL